MAKCFDRLLGRMQKCIDNEEKRFEKPQSHNKLLSIIFIIELKIKRVLLAIKGKFLLFASK